MDEVDCEFAIHSCRETKEEHTLKFTVSRALIIMNVWYSNHPSLLLLVMSDTGAGSSSSPALDHPNHIHKLTATTRAKTGARSQWRTKPHPDSPPTRAPKQPSSQKVCHIGGNYTTHPPTFTHRCLKCTPRKEQACTSPEGLIRTRRVESW